MLQGKLESIQIRLTWHKPGGCLCLCNRQGVLQALLNLVLNAVDAAAKSSDPEVLIEAKCDSLWVYFAVDDNGPGVSAEIREKIFEPFFTTKPSGKGTGLGLAISRQLVRAAGGDLELSHEPSQLGGARFVIHTPRVLHKE